MLFDLRSAGRRRTIQIAYVFLALLMLGGLVFFGAGSSLNGGLLNALTDSPKTTSTTKGLKKKETQLLATIEANPKDQAAYLSLTDTRLKLALSSGDYDSNKNSYSKKGKVELQKASDSWTTYLNLANNPSVPIARQMVVIYSGPLAQYQNAATAQQIVAQSAPTAQNYFALAIYAYAGGDNRLGDLAGGKSVDLTPKGKQAAFKKQLAAAKKQAQNAYKQQQAAKATTKVNSTSKPSPSKSSSSNKTSNTSSTTKK